MPPPGMLPPGLFPGLIRPGIQQQAPPTGGTAFMTDPPSQGDVEDKDKPKDSDDKREGNNEEKETAKGKLS